MQAFNNVSIAICSKRAVVTQETVCLKEVSSGNFRLESALRRLCHHRVTQERTLHKGWKTSLNSSETAQIFLLKYIIDSLHFHPLHLPVLGLPAISGLASAGCVSPIPHLPLQCPHYAVTLKLCPVAFVLLLAPWLTALAGPKAYGPSHLSWCEMKYCSNPFHPVQQKVSQALASQSSGYVEGTCGNKAGKDTDGKVCS